MLGRSPSVLQVVLSLDPGGTERLVTDLVTRLQPTMPMAVCCLDHMGAWGESLAARGIAVEALSRRPGFRPMLAASVASMADRTGARVLHCHQYSPFVYGALAHLAAPRLRVLFTEHGRLSDAPPSPKRRRLNPVLARLARRIFSVSHDLRRHMVAEGFPASRIEVVHNGIEPGTDAAGDREAVRACLDVPASALVLITVARLDPVKDLGTLLRAVRHASKAVPDLVLAVVGDGPERDALERAAAAVDLGTTVRFLGHRDNARWWLAGADIYVNSSISEGISLTILEAMAAGLPVVATSVGGTPEVVDGSCGLLVPARDPDRLAEALVALGGDRGLRLRLGAAARSRVLASFSLDRMVDTYRRAYEEAD